MRISDRTQLAPPCYVQLKIFKYSYIQFGTKKKTLVLNKNSVSLVVSYKVLATNHEEYFDILLIVILCSSPCLEPPPYSLALVLVPWAGPCVRVSASHTIHPPQLL